MSGATSLAGAGGEKGFLRNVDDKDTSLFEGLGITPADSDTFPLGDTGGKLLASGCEYGNSKTTSASIKDLDGYLPHIAEGIDNEARNELTCTSNDDSAAGRNDLFQKQTAVIHAVAVGPEEAALFRADQTAVIWSPRSNVDLYGNTSPVTLLDVSASLASTLDLEPLLGIVLEQLESLFDYADASILISEADHYRLLETREKGFCVNPEMRGRKFPLRGLLVERPTSREPLIIPDITSDEDPMAESYREAVGFRRGTRTGWIRSVMSAPLENRIASQMKLPIDASGRLRSSGDAERPSTSAATGPTSAFQRSTCPTHALSIGNSSA